jgi:nitroreductase
MDLLPELLARRARRGLSAEELPEEQVRRLLEAACLAPSCYNNQPWRFILLRGVALEAFRPLLPEGNRWATRAPLVIVLATKASLDCRLDEGRDYAYFDVGQAALALQLQATREGLVAHPIAGYPPAKLRKLIQLPEDFLPLALVIVGKPGSTELLAEWQLARERGERERKPLAELAYEGSWGEALPS